MCWIDVGLLMWGCCCGVVGLLLWGCCCGIVVVGLLLMLLSLFIVVEW